MKYLSRVKLKLDENITDPKAQYCVDIEVVDQVGSHFFYSQTFSVSPQHRIIKHYSNRKPQALEIIVRLCDQLTK